MSWYKIRLGGTNEFASLIDPDYKLCCPPGTVEFVEGWSNPDALIYKNKEDAEAAEKLIWKIEGFHTSVEEYG